MQYCSNCNIELYLSTGYELSYCKKHKKHKKHPVLCVCCKMICAYTKKIVEDSICFECLSNKCNIIFCKSCSVEIGTGVMPKGKYQCGLCASANICCIICKGAVASSNKNYCNYIICSECFLYKCHECNMYLNECICKYNFIDVVRTCSKCGAFMVENKCLNCLNRCEYCNTVKVNRNGILTCTTCSSTYKLQNCPNCGRTIVNSCNWCCKICKIGEAYNDYCPQCEINIRYKIKITPSNFKYESQYIKDFVITFLIIMKIYRKKIVKPLIFKIINLIM